MRAGEVKKSDSSVQTGWVFSHIRVASRPCGESKVQWISVFFHSCIKKASQLNGLSAPRRLEATSSSARWRRSHNRGTDNAFFCVHLHHEMSSPLLRNETVKLCTGEHVNTKPALFSVKTIMSCVLCDFIQSYLGTGQGLQQLKG